MEKLNIKLLLNAIAEEGLVSEDDSVNPPSQTNENPVNYSYLLEQEGYSSLLAQFEGDDAAAVMVTAFILAIGALITAYGAKFLKCLKKIKKLISPEGDWGKKFRKIRTELASIARGSTTEAIKWFELAQLAGDLARELKDAGCWNRLLRNSLLDKLERIFHHRAHAGARTSIGQALDGVKSWVDAFGEALASARPELVKHYAASVAVSNSQLAQQCSSGLSATEATLLIAGGVALIAAVVLTGGAAGVIAAKLAAVGGGLAVCGTALSADDLASAGEEAARLQGEYFDAANIPNAEEEYIDTVLDPSGLSDLNNYPGNPGG